jgi:glucuronosyltransferase
MFTPLYFNYLREFNYFPELEKIIRKHLNPHFPSASDYERNVSLLMVNYHFAEDFSRPLPPNVIPVGGMQCAERLQELPKEIKEFLKDDEFIYMSFGSYAEISSYPEEAQKVIFNSLKKLKLKVLWKSDVERPKDFPKNIYTAEWMPQQAILGKKLNN